MTTTNDSLVQRIVWLIETLHGGQAETKRNAIDDGKVKTEKEPTLLFSRTRSRIRSVENGQLAWPSIVFTYYYYQSGPITEEEKTKKLHKKRKEMK